MVRLSPWLVLPILLLGSPLPSQQIDPNKKADPPPLAEVRLTDDSSVRMLVLQEYIEVSTKYGKLTVPTRDLLKIEIGIDVPADVEKWVAQAIDNLGNDNYKTRELALKGLVDLGPQAYPQVVAAAKSEQPEVAKRAAIAIERMKAKYPVENLRLRKDDVITTVNFPIVGKIVPATLKVKNETFGVMELKLTQVRSVRWVSANADADVVVDAATHGSMPNQWLDTGYDVTAGSRLVMVAGGSVNLWPQGGGYICGPRGFNTTGVSPPGTQFAAGALLARIGPDGPIFQVGERYEGASPRDGRIYLHIVPSPWNNPSTGTFQVKIIPSSGQAGK